MRFLLLLLFTLSGRVAFAGSNALQRFEYEQPHMGTLFRIVLYADAETQARQAAAAAFYRINELNKILSDYDPESELSRLSATAGKGQAVKLSPDLWYILHKSVQIAAQTNGAFDVTIGPLVQLWRRARRQHELPNPEALAQARKAVGFRHVLLDAKAKTAQLMVPGMQLDLGAIGKGYAVDEAMKVLKNNHIKSALIDGGGNILVSQAPPGSRGWAIALLPYLATDQPDNDKILLTHGGVATSGDLYQHLEINGVHYSHIVNPFTGLGLTHERQVAIIAKNATDADWLSTALSVLDLAAGEALLKKVPKAAAVIQKNNQGFIEHNKLGRFKKYLPKTNPYKLRLK